MKFGVECKANIATLTLTPDSSKPDDICVAKIKELIIKTFEEHLKISELPDMTFEVEVVPGEKYKFIVVACFSFQSPVIDEINKTLKEFGL